MNKIMTICVIDTNRFFAQGVKLILLPYFKQRGQGVFFVGEESIARADLVLWSVNNELPKPLFIQSRRRGARSPIYIVVRDSMENKLGGYRCLCHYGSLLRAASPQSLLAIVEKALSERDSSVFPARNCRCCALLKLTKREKEVMTCLTQEMPQKSLPQYLKISAKTVSAHKRTVMQKLGFKRNEELYHWLRCGGLFHLMRN